MDCYWDHFFVPVSCSRIPLQSTAKMIAQISHQLVYSIEVPFFPKLALNYTSTLNSKHTDCIIVYPGWGDNFITPNVRANYYVGHGESYALIGQSPLHWSLSLHLFLNYEKLLVLCGKAKLICVGHKMRSAKVSAAKYCAPTAQVTPVPSAAFPLFVYCEVIKQARKKQDTFLLLTERITFMFHSR